MVIIERIRTLKPLGSLNQLVEIVLMVITRVKYQPLLFIIRVIQSPLLKNNQIFSCCIFDRNMILYKIYLILNTNY